MCVRVCVCSGAGKTHTMLGSPEEPGVIFLTMKELYRRIDALRDTKTCTISISYCEVRKHTHKHTLLDQRISNHL